MATIIAYTTIEQSRKLAEILSIESVDMLFQLGEDKYADSIRVPLTKKHWEQMMPAINPCWSLSALLGVLPFPVLYMEMLGGMILWSCECHFMETDEVVKIEHYKNPVDACVSMIIKLNELNLL